MYSAGSKFNQEFFVNQISLKYVPAQNADMHRLPHLLALHPEQVLIRDAFGGYCSLTTLVHGPFYTRQEGGFWVLFGTRLTDEKTVCLRVIQHKTVPVLQWKESTNEPWRLDPGWVPVHQLYVPRKLS